jgi:hypothetical protein
MKTLKVTNSEGRDFTVRLVYEGETYGRTGSLIHDKTDPLVEFYDSSQSVETFGIYGQFVSRYYMSTILDGDDTGTVGLVLDGGVDVWYVDGYNMKEIQEWIYDMSF